MKQKFKTGQTIKYMVILIIMSLFAGCMETSEPADTNVYNLHVKTFMVNPDQPDELIPLRGVDVTLIDGTTENSTPAQKTTNENGSAEFELTVPLIGMNYNVLAEYNGIVQSKTNLLICRDTLVVFVFDQESAENIDCENLDGSDTLVFVDDLGLPVLRQNSPEGIGRYERCWTLANSLASGETITVTIPEVSDPFEILAILVGFQSVPNSERTIELEPGQTLTVCYSVSTKTAGTYEETVDFALSCSENTGTYSVTLQAEVVEPDCLCESLADYYLFEFPDRVQVGESEDHEEIVLTNSLSCPIEVRLPASTGLNAFTILSPDFPVTLQPGETLSMNVRFTPLQADENRESVELEIIPAGNGENCTIEIEFSGNGCNNTCPLFSEDRLLYYEFSRLKVVDTLSNRDDNRVFVSSAAGFIFSDVSTVSETYYVFNPDSACSEVNVNIITEFADEYSSKYFTVNPSSLNLAPGESGIIEVTFTAPTLEEFEAITAARGNTGALTDSLFKVVIRVESQGCRQIIEDNAVVTVYPDISPIINLRAYNQRTPQKPNPENEIYYFGADARTINQSSGGGPGEYPPEVGDIYIDVDDNNADPTVDPQDPILVLRNTSIEMKLWRSNYPESDFTNVPQLINDFSSDPNYNTGYSTTPLTNLQIGDVIAFKFSERVYALVYIRRVDNGSENTSSHQSGIEFRSVYPIYI